MTLRMSDNGGLGFLRTVLLVLFVVTHFLVFWVVWAGNLGSDV